METARVPFDCQIRLRDFLCDQHQKRKRRKDSTKMYFCGFCAKAFQFPSLLKRHIPVHNKTETSVPVVLAPQETVISEEENARVFTSVADGEKPGRQSTIHPESSSPSPPNNKTRKEEYRHFCDVCQKRFRRPYQLRNHQPCPLLKSEPSPVVVKQEENLKRLSCKVCGRTFTQARLLAKHSKLHTSKKQEPAVVKQEKNPQRLSCKVCKRSFTQAKLLAKHSKLHNKKNNLKRGMQLSSQKVLLKSKPKLHECQVCHERFSFNYRLQQHFRIHTGEKPFSCPVCMRKFSSQRSIREHKCVPESVVAAHPCVVCGLSFPDKNQLKEHSVVHKDVKTYMCQVCRKCFKRPQNLQEHYLTHSNEKPFSCKRCGKGFRRIRDMKQHKHCNKPRNKLISKHDSNIDHSEEQLGNRGLSVKARTSRDNCANQKDLELFLPVVPQSSGLSRRNDDLALAIIPSRTFSNVHNLKFLGSDKCYPCELCGKEFSRADVLREHYWTHTKQKPFPCELCGNSFGRPGLLKKHVCIPTFTETVKKAYRCNVCNKIFHRVSNLKQHLETHAGAKPHSCHMCPQKFYCEDQLKKHYETHSNDARYSCLVCQKTFVHMWQLKKHGLCKSFTCHLCRRTFKKQAHLVEHLAVHAGTKSFTCSLCPKSYKRERELKSHKLMVHLGQKGHKCLVCGQTFSQNTKLVEHYLQHKMAPYSCNICKMTFSQIRDLKQHQPCKSNTNLMKKGMAILPCLVCNKTFTGESSLKRHMITHSGEKNFICHICSRRFSRMDHLNDHVRTHTGEKRHTCKVCGKGFNRPSELRMHGPCSKKPFLPPVTKKVDSRRRSSNPKRTTSESKRCHACTMCGKRFRRPSHLKEHTMIHTGQKPFSCEICLQGFMRHTQLRNHRLTKHGLSGESSYNLPDMEVENGNYGDAFNLLEIKEEPIEEDGFISVEGDQDDMSRNPLNLVQIKYEEQDKVFSERDFVPPELGDDICILDTDDCDSGPPDLSQECDIEIVEEHNHNSNPPELHQEIEDVDAFEEGENCYSNPDNSLEHNDEKCTDSPLIIQEQQIIIKDCSSLFNPDQQIQDNFHETDNIEIIEEFNSVVRVVNQEKQQEQQQPQLLVDDSGSSSDDGVINQDQQQQPQPFVDNCGGSLVDDAVNRKDQRQQPQLFVADCGSSLVDVTVNQEDQQQPPKPFVDDCGGSSVDDAGNEEGQQQLQSQPFVDNFGSVSVDGAVNEAAKHQQPQLFVDDHKCFSVDRNLDDHVTRDVNPNDVKKSHVHDLNFSIPQEHSHFIVSDCKNISSINFEQEVDDSIRKFSEPQMNQVNCDKTLCRMDASETAEKDLPQCGGCDAEENLSHCATLDQHEAGRSVLDNNVHAEDQGSPAQNETRNNDCSTLNSLDENVEGKFLTGNDDERFSPQFNSMNENSLDFNQANNLDLQQFDCKNTQRSNNLNMEDFNLELHVNRELKLQCKSMEHDTNQLGIEEEGSLNSGNLLEVCWDKNFDKVVKCYTSFHQQELSHEKENCNNGNPEVLLTDQQEKTVGVETSDNGDDDQPAVNLEQDIFVSIESVANPVHLNLNENIVSNDNKASDMLEVVQEHNVYVDQFHSENSFKPQQNIIEHIVPSNL